MLGAWLFCFHSVFLIGRWTTMPSFAYTSFGEEEEEERGSLSLTLSRTGPARLSPVAI
jgi:hypothetical protein